jgi:hypothetical protein
MMEKKWIEMNYNKKNKPINNYGFFNDQIQEHYFYKSISWSFFVGLIFSPLTCMSKICLGGQPFLWILLID